MKTADPELMRAINRFHVMDAIRRFGPVSRVEISQLTELSATTVSAITAALLDDRLIVPLQVGAVRDAGRGRPRVMLKLNPGAAYVVGVKLAPDQITVAVTNFCADVLRSLALPVRIDRQTAAVIADLVEDGVRRCVSDAGLDITEISGVCVGLPGVVERAAGVCRQSPILQERDVPFGADLTYRLGVPASIDNDVNLVTLAEHWFGQARDLNDFLVVNVERSIGLGILHNGELFRGANGLSPDLGDLIVRLPGGGDGRLADVASEASVLIEAEALMGDGEAEATSHPGRAMALLLKRAAAGDRRCARALAAAGEALGFAVANLITLFAPPKVIISGRAMATSDHFMEPLRKTVAHLLPASLADISDIIVREWSDGNWLQGAAAMTLRDLYGAPWGTTGPAPIREALAPQIGESLMKPVGIGVIGCGNISAAYLATAKKFPILNLVALADTNAAAAQARGSEFGVPARPVDAVLSDPAVEIVLNLTVPKAHVDVGLKAIAAGKHVHSEKPLGVTVAEARRLIEAAAAKGLRLGSAPDTFLGGAHQTARRAVDEGLIGRPIGGAAFFMCPGHERWHPNPGFYYLAGGGPMLDMGPYYVTDLVNLLGPVASVSGVATRARSERVVTSEPLAGTRVPVEVATHVTGTLMFASGAAISMTMSFDVSRHRHGPIELYGETGSLIVPDPNHFGGKVEFATASEDWREIPTQGPYADGNYRIVGLADMAQAIRSGRPHRASGELAFHVLEVMEAFGTSSDAGEAVKMSTRPRRPAPLPPSLGVGELD